LNPFINIINIALIYSYFLDDINIKPIIVKIPPKKIFKPIISPKIKYANMVANTGSPIGNVATTVGETNLIA
jgi:hypothetical protein